MCDFHLNYTIPTVEYTITEKSFDGAIVTFPNGTSYPYMGSDNGVEPEVQVTLDGNVLTAGTDYEVSYQNNKACGTATVTVTGKGSYAGSVTAPFTIVSHDIAAADVTVDPIPNQGIHWSAGDSGSQSDLRRLHLKAG